MYWAWSDCFSRFSLISSAWHSSLTHISFSKNCIRNTLMIYHDKTNCFLPCVVVSLELLLLTSPSPWTLQWHLPQFKPMVLLVCPRQCHRQISSEIVGCQGVGCCLRSQPLYFSLVMFSPLYVHLTVFRIKEKRFFTPQTKWETQVILRYLFPSGYTRLLTEIFCNRTGTVTLVNIWDCLLVAYFLLSSMRSSWLRIQ